MIRRPPGPTLTVPLFPYSTLFRSFHGPDSTRHATVWLVLPPGRLLWRYRFQADLWMGRYSGHPSASTELRYTESFWAACGRCATARKDSGSGRQVRSEEHTSELQSLMRISYAVFCLKNKQHNTTH